MDPKAKIGLSANAVTIKHIEITDVQLPATCFLQLVTEGEGGNSSLKQIKFNQQYVTSAVLRPLWTCFWISLVVAGLAWIFACLTKPVSPIFMLGSPSWDFAKSWTSNATLVGGIVTTALSLSALPELTKYASKSGYSALALLLTFVVTVAPFIFIALRSGTVQKDAATKQDVVVYQGYLLPFLLSGAITLFAGLAQLLVLFFLLKEVFENYRLWLFWPYCESWSFLTLALGLAMYWYVGSSMVLTIKLQLAADGDASTKATAKAAKDFADRPKTASQDENPPGDIRAKGPLLSWPVF